jgi:transposase-like protein
VGDGVTDADRDRVTVQEAARRLGVSEQAIRKRVKRRTLEHEKEEDGRVYVYLDAVEDDAPNPHSDPLISRLEDEIAYLREESRRKDEIIMQQAITMRRLSAPESPETASGAGAEEGPPEQSEGPETGAQRPWWRRLFGS